MIENLVDAWLTEASERSYETAFSQLLVIEGHRVIQGPMHHAYEHGKDIIAWNPEEELCVYQLKGGRGKLGVRSLERIQPQLHAASTSAVMHPSLPSSRTPDRVYLVTNQTATGPAQNRLHAISEGLSERRFASLQMIERAELCSRFVAAEGRFFPTSPKGLKTFLSLFLADGRGELPRRDFFSLLEEVLPFSPASPNPANAARSVAATALVTAFALQKWTELENYAEVFMGWVCYATQVLRLAEMHRLGRRHWERSYRLALEEARRNARHLLDEAVNAEDLVMPHECESLVYGARAVKVCGLVSALAMSERIEFGPEHSCEESAAALVLRELQFFRICGEVQAPDFFLATLAVKGAVGEQVADAMLLSWVQGVARANQVGSASPLPDPYHSPEEVLEAQLSPAGSFLADEDFAGNAYTIHGGVRWATRRLLREPLNSAWGEVSRISHCCFEPSVPSDYLTPETRHGRMVSWFYSLPTSWSGLQAEAGECGSSSLPRVLLECREFVPFYCLALPHRFNFRIADLLDDLVSPGLERGASGGSSSSSEELGTTGPESSPDPSVGQC